MFSLVESVDRHAKRIQEGALGTNTAIALIIGEMQAAHTIPIQPAAGWHSLESKQLHTALHRLELALDGIQAEMEASELFDPSTYFEINEFKPRRVDCDQGVQVVLGHAAAELEHFIRSTIHQALTSRLDQLINGPSPEPTPAET